MSICNRLDLQALGSRARHFVSMGAHGHKVYGYARILACYAQKSPRSLIKVYVGV